MANGNQNSFEVWTCPNCEAKNKTQRCIVCGTNRPLRQYTSPQYVPDRNSKGFQGAYSPERMPERPKVEKIFKWLPILIIVGILVVFALIIGMIGIGKAFITNYYNESKKTSEGSFTEEDLPIGRSSSLPSTSSIDNSDLLSSNTLDGAFCPHEWSEATCSLPEHCEKCGETRGTNLDHSWIDATCLTAMSCESCGETSGTPLEHEWGEATYSSPSTCLQCGTQAVATFAYSPLTSTEGLRSDGTVLLNSVVIYGTGITEIPSWKDVVSLSYCYGDVAAVRRDGTVVSNRDNYAPPYETEEWHNIVSVACGSGFIVGLKNDGTVISSGDFPYDISTWENIVSIAAGIDHLVGLKADGTVIATGNNEYGQCDVEGWTNIKSISTGDSNTFGVHNDGTVTTVGYDSWNQCDVSGWRNIVSVAVGSSHTLGLKEDGTVVAVGYSGNGQCEVSGWRDIVAISAGYANSFGVTKDGKVKSQGYQIGDARNWSGMMVWQPD